MKGTITLPGKLTISRPFDNHATEEYIRIQLEDAASHSNVAIIEVPVADFARALTGLASVSATFEYWPKAWRLIGCKYEHKNELIALPDLLPSQIPSDAVRAAVAIHETEGWRGDDTTARNHHNYDRKAGKVRVTYRRHVRPDGTPVEAEEEHDA